MGISIRRAGTSRPKPGKSVAELSQTGYAARSAAIGVGGADAIRVVAEGVSLGLEDDHLGQLIVGLEEGDIAHRAGAAEPVAAQKLRVLRLRQFIDIGLRLARGDRVPFAFLARGDLPDCDRLAVAEGDPVRAERHIAGDRHCRVAVGGETLGGRGGGDEGKGEECGEEEGFHRKILENVAVKHNTAGAKSSASKVP